MQNFGEILFEPFRKFWESFAAFMPNFLAMVIIFAVGVVVAIVLKYVISAILKGLNFDPWCDKVGVTAVIRKGNMWGKPTDIVSNIVKFVLLLIFFMIGLAALRIQAVDRLIEQFFLYMPKAFSSVIILVVGYIIAGFLSRGVLITAVNSGFRYAKILSESVRLLIFILVLAMSLEQLSIAPGIVIAAFSIIFGGVVLSLAIAFGVGGIEEARKLISSCSKEEEKKNDINHF